MNTGEMFLFIVNLLRFRCGVPLETFVRFTENEEDGLWEVILPTSFSCSVLWFISWIKKSRVAGKIKASAVEFLQQGGVEKELELLEKYEVRILTPLSATFPHQLRQVTPLPITLYCLGEMSCLKRPMVSIVGARATTSAGKRIAWDMARGLSSVGITVVSGFARGVDGAAHRGALGLPLRGALAPVTSKEADSLAPPLAKGGTVAAIGAGIDVLYPAEHTVLRGPVEENGMIISEFPFFESPLPWHFPLRNRIIAGLSNHTIVIEAAKNSGSLITASLALEYGREVMAVPGDVCRRGAQGTNQLIRDGAALVRDAQDVLDSMGLASLPLESFADRTVDLPSGASEVVNVLGQGPLSVDQMIVKTGMAYGALNRALFELMKRGFVMRDTGNIFSLVASFQ